MAPGAGVNFDALCSTFDTTCTKRVGSTSTTHGASGRSTVSVSPACVDRGALRVDGALDELGQRRRLAPQHDLARGDARDVEQVVDQPHHVADLRSIIDADAPDRWPVVSPETRISSRPVRIGASGLRSSWASSARNSSLRRSASQQPALGLRDGDARACTCVGDVAEVADQPVAAVREGDAVEPPFVVLGHAAVDAELGALRRDVRLAGRQRAAGRSRRSRPRTPSPRGCA